MKNTNHVINFDDVTIIDKESDYNKRKFKEALAIKRSSTPLLNKKEKIRILSHIWENLL